MLGRDSYLPSSFVRRQGDMFRNSYPESYKAASSVSPLLCPIPSNALQLIFLNSILELVLTFLSYDESVSSFFDNLVTFHPFFSFVFSSIFQRLLLKTPLLWPPTKSASGSSIQRSPSNSALFRASLQCLRRNLTSTMLGYLPTRAWSLAPAPLLLRGRSPPIRRRTPFVRS